MSITCPTKSLKDWKDLVNVVGENEAYALWAHFDGYVPENYYTPKINETDIENKSLFGLENSSNDQLEFHINTINSVSEFLSSAGVDIKFVSEFLSNDGDILSGALAAANFIENTVDIIGDPTKRPNAWNKLPEETAHWWYRLLKDSSPLKNELWEAHQTLSKRDELYKTQYGKLVESAEDLTEEAIGQLIADQIKQLEIKNGAPKNYSFLKKFLDWVNELLKNFISSKQNPFEIAAMKILSSDMSELMSLEEYNIIYNSIYPENIDIRENDNDYNFGDEVLIEDSDWYKNLSKRFRLRKGIKSKTIKKIQDALGRQQSISKIKLKPSEKKFLIGNNQYENVTPELLSIENLRKKYKNGIALKSPIVLDAKKFDVDLYNDVRELLSFEWNYPEIKTIKIEDFINEVFNYLNANYLLGFANESKFLTYRIPQTFTHTGNNKRFPRSINMDNLTEADMNMALANDLGLNDNFEVQHRKVSLRFNDEYVSGKSHFEYSPSAWGNITYFSKDGSKVDSVLIHEIQNDFIEKLNAIDNSLEVKYEFTKYLKLPGFFSKLTGTYDQFQEVLNEQINLIESSKPWANLNDINNSIKYNFERQKDALKIFNPSNEDLVNLVRINNGEFVFSEQFTAKALEISKKIAPELQNIISSRLSLDFRGESNLSLNTRKAKIHSKKQYVYRIGLNIKNSFKKINLFNIKDKSSAIKAIKKLEALERYKKLSESDFIKLYSNYSNNLKFLSGMIKEKQFEEKLNAPLEKKYFNPIAHRLIQTVIKEKGKDFDMYFSGQQITMLTQGAEATADIYAGPEEVAKGLSSKIGPLYLAFSKINGISLEYVENIPGFTHSVGGYKVNLSKYNYKAPILFGLGTESGSNKSPNKDSNDKLRLKHFTDFVGLNKKTVSPNQKISVAQRTKKYNDTNRTGHYVKFSRVGESMNYTWSVSQNWNNYNPTQLNLFQLSSEKSEKEVNKDLDIKLKQQLGELGISIKSIDEFMDRHNISPVGVSDIIKGIIYIDANKANELTLPEETAHFIIELLGDSALAKRLLTLVEANDYYKEVLGSEFDSYSEVYKSDKDMLVREAAGKLLSQAIVSKFNEQNSGIPSDKLNLLERLWAYAKNLFNKITKQRFNKDILDAYGNTADQFLRGTLSGLDTKNLTRKIIMFQISDKALNNLKDKLEKSKEAIAKRISVYKRKDLKKLALREEETLTTLIEDLDDKNYLTAALNVAESARDRFVKVNKRIVELEKSIENLELQGNDGLLALASTLKDMKSFTNSYLPMMKEIKLEMTKMSISEGENEDIKKISAILTDTIDKAELLDSEYYKMAKPIYARFISPLIGNGPITDVNGVLELGGEDITFFQRWVDSAANSGEPMLQIIDLIVKDAKQEAKDESYDIMKDIIDARMKLEEHGIKDTKWMYEKKKDGTLSGNNVSEWNYGDWQDSKDKAKADTLERIRRSNKNIELPESDSDLLDEVFKNDVLIAQYKTLMNSWYKYNSQKNPYADDIIAMKARELSDEDFEEWYDENTHLDEFSGTLYYKNELSVPAEKYRNPQYAEIMSNPAKKEFYNLTMNMKESLDSKLPQNRRLGKLAPQLRTDFIQKMKSSKNVSELARNAKESIREQFQNVEDDTEMGDRFKMTDENGNPVNFLPIYFTGKLANSKDLSTDFAESMSAFASMATDYSKMSKVLDMLEMGRDIISNRDLISKDANGNVLKESINILGKKIAKSIKKDPNSSNLKARLDDYFLMNIYGKTRSEGTDFNILGFNINSEKALDMLGRYTSLNNLALNIYAGIQNPLVGNSAIRLEAIAGQFFSNKDLLAADAKYTKTLANYMANVGSRNPKDWLSLWMEKMEVMQDFSRKSKEINMDRKGLFSKLFTSNSLFVLSHAGEHQMQSRTSFALANSIKLKDADGKDTTLLDAFEIVGNKLVLKSGIKKLDGKPFTEADIRQFKRKQNAINNSLHGIYNDQDLLAIQQYGLLRQALIFRKFMRPGFNRRFRKKYYNYEGQFDVEGYYRTTGRFVATLANDLKRGQFLLAAHWNELTELEKQNIIRTATEAGYMLAVSLLLNFILPMMGGDDDDEWLASMVAYQANRLNTELKFYVDPRQTITILKSPAAGIQTINGVLNLLATAANPWTASEVISRGKYEGYTRLHKASVQSIPLYKSINDWMFPEDKLIYFQLQNK